MAACCFLREHHARLFEEQQTVRGFMNQDSQRKRVCCILYMTAWTMTYCLPAFVVGAVAPRSRAAAAWQHSIRSSGGGGSSGSAGSGGSDGDDDDGSDGNTTLQLRLQFDEHRCGSCIARVEIAYGVNTAERKRGIFRCQGTLRVCSHYPPELACDLFVTQPRRVRSAYVGRCVVAGVRSCQGVEALPPSPCGLPACGSPTRIAIGHGAPTRMPPLGLAIVPCGPGIGCCDTSDGAVASGRSGHDWRCVRRRAMAFSTLYSSTAFTGDVHATICLDLLVGRVRLFTSRATDVRPFPFGEQFCYSFPTVYIGIGR